ncbi:unnamed protein product [Ascophyllum nodosum]
MFYETTDQDYLENPELKVYVEDVLRLVLANRPERPLDLIDDYLQSVLSQNNVMGREYAYVNATMRNRRAFVLAVDEVFIGSSVARDDDNLCRDSFAQRDVVHLLGLICPDFPEEIVTKVEKILIEGMEDVGKPLTATKCHGRGSPLAEELTNPSPTFVRNSMNALPSPNSCSSSPPPAKRPNALESMSSRTFFRAFTVFFCFQEFFEETGNIFESLSEGVDVNAGNAGGPEARGVEVNLEKLLEQLQLTTTGPWGQPRHLGITSIQAAVRKGKLAERVTLPVFLACLFLHSDAESARLLKRDTPECYAEKFEACPALWNDNGNGLQPSIDGGGDIGESTGRRRKGSKKGGDGRNAL